MTKLANKKLSSVLQEKKFDILQFFYMKFEKKCERNSHSGDNFVKSLIKTLHFIQNNLYKINIDETNLFLNLNRPSAVPNFKEDVQ